MNSRAKELRESLKIMGLHYSDNITFQKGIEHALSTPSVLCHADPETMRQAGWVREEEWISVEDRLPPHGKIVLFYIPMYDNISTGHVFNDEIFINNNSAIGTPTHWKPLPQPPKK